MKRSRAYAQFLRAAALVCAGCTGAPAAYPLRAPVTVDPDRRPYQADLQPYFSPNEWDHLDNSFFWPTTRLFAVAPGGEAINVNALDEVPDSSWFENRVAQLTPAAMALGPCDPEAPEPRSPWQIVAGKPDGVNPGFVVEDSSGQRYLLKLDTGMQGPRGSTADVVASRIYHAAGFDVPCNSVVYFSRSMLTLGSSAEVTLPDGEAAGLTWSHVDQALAHTWRSRDGRYRGALSRYLAGRPLGPWQYRGTRAGDRNDVVAHEDRRELRGSRLLAAWTGHWDAREQNTLAMWIETSGGRGFVRHHLLDFGDCFGAFAGRSASWVRRRGEVYWFDPTQIVGDIVTLGAVQHSWERARLGPSGPIFGFFDVERFDPQAWSTSYPNPAFVRSTERDAAWMARIIARLGKPELDAMVTVGRLEPALHAELVRLLLGRRRKLLERYLTRLSPLAGPRLVSRGSETWLCLDDLGLTLEAVSPRRYSARAWLGMPAQELEAPPVQAGPARDVCVLLPNAARSSPRTPKYLALEISTQPAPEAPHPARLYLYQTGSGRYTVVALERLPSSPHD